MATQEQVKEYLACWFQLGKGIEVAEDNRLVRFKSILYGDRYSREFENYWQKILRAKGKGFSLEGTHQSVDELFSSHWEMHACCRCRLPIPVRELGNQCLLCPCADLQGWPNLELPTPRSPIDSRSHLGKICDRVAELQQNTPPDAPGLPYALAVQLAKYYERDEEEKE
ncbi:MAG: hypothetical protein J7647_18450 [Cyanobacteria bacterium SBLK]|nr:hypothetical protein [Cyanobacteria bacterium SBLK]